MFELHVNRKRMRIASALLLGANACMVLIFLVARPALREDGWAFLERQRPVKSDNGMTMTIVADGLNFALARRAVGGWESSLVRLFLLVNLPAYFVSFLTFQALQDFAFASSRTNSDITTILFVIVAFLQWLGVGALCGIGKARKPAPN